MSDATTLQRLADLLVGFGANVQPGQIVAVSSEIGKEPLTRAVAASAYRHGATFVEVSYSDIHVRRARIEFGSDEALETVPPWLGERILRLGDARAARIALTGPVEPGLLEDLDPARVGRDKSQALREAGKVVNERTTNWTIGPCPTLGWATLVHPELEPEAALAKLWEEIVHVCRLDTDDPVAAWRERMATLVGVSERLTAARLRRDPLRGPRHRPDRRPAAEQQIHLRRLRDRRRDPARAQPAVGGGLHDPRPVARRRRRALDQAAADRRRDDQRADGPLRGRPRRRDRRRAGGGDAARDDLARRRRRPPRRAGAGRRRGPHRPARDGLLRHAARTRTPPATSRWAAASTSPSARTTSPASTTA